MYQRYLAPESLLAGKFSPAADVWGVGCLVVRMLSGKLPYAEHEMGEEALHTLVAQQDIHPKLPTCSPQMKDFLLKCFARDPSERPTVRTLKEHPALLMANADEDDLAHAQVSLNPILPTSHEYERVKENFSKAMLKSSDSRKVYLELEGVQEVRNEVLRKRFNIILSSSGNHTVGFYGVAPERRGSVLRFGVLRLGHPLIRSTFVQQRDLSTYISLGDRTKGIHLFRSPTNAAWFSAENSELHIGDVVKIIMLDVCLGSQESSPTSKASSTPLPSVQSRESDTEFYLFDEAQACPAYVLSVRVVPALEKVAELPASYVVFSEKELGHGAFGRVLMGMEFPRGIPVAVKQFECRSGADEVKAEFDTLVSLKGFKHVMGVRHFEITEGRACMVMELLSMSINDVIRSAGPLPESVVRKYMFEAAQGVEELGLEGIIHRDIKPANMMIAPDGTLKLTDFGLSVTRAHTMPQQGRQSPASTGVKGTPLFLAPELLNGVQCTPASDIWALGCSIVCMLRGSQTPYEKNRNHRKSFSADVCHRISDHPATNTCASVRRSADTHRALHRGGPCCAAQGC